MVLECHTKNRKSEDQIEVVRERKCYLECNFDKIMYVKKVRKLYHNDKVLIDFYLE